MFDMHILNYGKLHTKKQLQETKINDSRKQANLKYQNTKNTFLVSYTYLISKLGHIKFINELDNERTFHGYQIKAAHFLYNRTKRIF